MILEPGRQRLENLKFKVSLDYVVSFSLAWDTQQLPAQERVGTRCRCEEWGRKCQYVLFFLAAMFITKYSGCLFDLYR